MKTIFIGSTGPHSGRTLMAWSLTRALTERGLDVGFYKPYPREESLLGGGRLDPDQAIMQAALDLTDLPAWIEKRPGREVLATLGIQQVETMIFDEFREASDGKDALVVMGSREMFSDSVLPGPPDSSLVPLFEADVVLMDTYRSDSTSIYSILSINSLLGGRVRSVILNRIPPDLVEEVKDSLVPFLEKHGIHVGAVIPEDPELSMVTVKGIACTLEGEVLCCADKLEGNVQSHTIGSIQLEGGLRLFRTVYNKVVLLGGGVSEDMEATKRTTVQGIVLTGGRPPSRKVVEAAESAQIPLILVEADTFATIDLLDRASPHVEAADRFKIERFGDWIEAGAGVNALLEQVGFEE